MLYKGVVGGGGGEHVLQIESKHYFDIDSCPTLTSQTDSHVASILRNSCRRPPDNALLRNLDPFVSQSGIIKQNILNFITNKNRSTIHNTNKYT